MLLMDGHLAALQCFVLLGVVVDEHHMVAEFRETRARHKPYVPTANDCYAHTPPRPQQTDA
jgi:hypothetical protein